MNVTLVVGARPNFVKAAPLIRALSRTPEIRQRLVHTGQHYDTEMSDSFFRDLRIPSPDINLEVGSGRHGEQTALIIDRFERDLLENRADAVIVFGDVNSTMAAAIVASKLRVPVVHVEAGLRSFDRTMPEEINRLVTDTLAEVCFTTDHYADENLLREGHPQSHIFRVGNIMIDSLVFHLEQAKKRNTLTLYGLQPKKFILVTLHRPSNVDDPETLNEILDALNELSDEWLVLFPVHPRTQKKMEELGCKTQNKSSLKLVEPLGYLDMLCASSQALGLVTDSGGLQEEGAYLRVPTLTLRPNTERPITIDSGTNRLVPSRKVDILQSAEIAFSKEVFGSPPELWDGTAAERMSRILADRLGGMRS